MKISRESLSDLYNEQTDALFSYGCKFTGDRELVKDCIHDVFVKLYEREDISNVRNMKFYLLRSFKNLLLDELSKSHPENIDEAQFSYIHDSSDETRSVEIDETVAIKKKYIEKIFENLTSRQKEAVYLYYIEELSYDEVSQMMGMNYQSVRNVVHRALAKLREKLGNKRPEFLLIVLTFFQKKSKK